MRQNDSALRDNIVIKAGNDSWILSVSYTGTRFPEIESKAGAFNLIVGDSLQGKKKKFEKQTFPLRWVRTDSTRWMPIKQAKAQHELASFLSQSTQSQNETAAGGGRSSQQSLQRHTPNPCMYMLGCLFYDHYCYSAGMAPKRLTKQQVVCHLCQNNHMEMAFPGQWSRIDDIKLTASE